ncbi:hypothetical protein SAMN03159391_00465 [Pseudomonas sp. NFACC37-1]|nr:hypothetical protein SAMN03159391_00465 [Pseudomonas sp. NFACC37-1]
MMPFRTMIFCRKLWRFWRAIDLKEEIFFLIRVKCKITLLRREFI